MSDDKTEMVTIEVSVADCEWIESRMVSTPALPSDRIRRQCRKALDARKSKYERWQEALNETQTMVPVYQDSLKGRLWAAAPQMLDLIKNIYQGFTLDPAAVRECGDVIRAALPKDVADEILGDSK